MLGLCRSQPQGRAVKAAHAAPPLHFCTSNTLAHAKHLAGRSEQEPTRSGGTVVLLRGVTQRLLWEAWTTQGPSLGRCVIVCIYLALSTYWGGVSASSSHNRHLHGRQGSLKSDNPVLPFVCSLRSSAGAAEAARTEPKSQDDFSSRLLDIETLPTQQDVCGGQTQSWSLKVS